MEFTQYELNLLKSAIKTMYEKVNNWLDKDIACGDTQYANVEAEILVNLGKLAKKIEKEIE